MTENSDPRPPSPFPEDLDSIADEALGGPTESVGPVSGPTTAAFQPLDLREPRPSRLTSIIPSHDPAALAVHTRDSLGLVQRFFYDRRMQNLQRHQAIKVAKAIYEAEYEYIIQQITLGLDIAKKRVFIEYLSANRDLQREIQRMAGDAVIVMVDVLQDVKMNVYENAARQAEKIRNAVRRGVMSELQAREELEKLAQLRDQNLEDAVLAYNTMRKNHMGLLQKTLELFSRDLVALKAPPA